MCGIAGFAGRGDLEDARNMGLCLAHRGPDGHGVHKIPNHPVFLAHQRLAVIDLADGLQPMQDASQLITVVYNGEIYNHRELRRELESLGHVFRTDHSDTEILVHGWKEWQQDLPGKLNGMFAFALFDQRTRQLFLARDRFGEKPLFWGFQKGNFYFASELSAFRYHQHFDSNPNMLSLYKLFAHGYIPAPNSLYADCWKLKPGSSLTYQIDCQSIDIESYWSFRIEADLQPPSFEEAAEELKRILHQSLKRRMMSDVPLGIFLSGGIDSSLVACIASTCQSDPIQSFSIGFHEKSYDESPYAQTVADVIGSRHKNQILNYDKARQLMKEVLPRIDEPICDSSILPTYFLCGFARKYVTVCLSGDGGDEIFGGYDPFAALLPARIYQSVVPKRMHCGIKKLVDLLPYSSRNMSLDFKLRRTMKGLDHPPELWLPSWMGPASMGDLQDLFQQDVQVEEVFSEVLALWREDPEKSPVDKTLEYFTNFYLPDDVLVKTDRASMMNSLEARSVFLDNELVDFARKLPAPYKFDGKNRKKILKVAANGIVPDSILKRPKKGFGIPLLYWLKQHDLSVEGSDQWGIHKESLEQMITAHQNAEQDHRLLIWAWLSLQAGACPMGAHTPPWQA